MNAGVKAGEKANAQAGETVVVTAKKIRVGFVSSHLRRHSICKLFCGLFLRLDRRVFEVVVFAALAESDHDKLTKAVLSGEGWLEGGGEVESVVIGMMTI